MAPSTRSVPDGFEALTDTISIYRPHVSHDGHSPSLVLICSWMAALPRHITKYTDQYKQLFPSSTILVMQSCWRDVAASDEKMVHRLAIAAETIKAHSPLQGGNSNGSGKIILHLFSNGGATTANHLSMQLHSHRLQLHEKRGRQLFSRVILECTPSRPDVSMAVKAISYALPRNFILFSIGAVLLRCYIAFGLFHCRVTGAENMVDRIRRRLNACYDEVPDGATAAAAAAAMSSTKKNDGGQLWDPTVPRLYLYSKGDEVVQWEAVRDHAADSRKAGFEVVREEVFETAPHVSLPREDFARYWSVVENWMRVEKGALEGLEDVENGITAKIFRKGCASMRARCRIG